jgi:hypothetical protein
MQSVCDVPFASYRADIHPRASTHVARQLLTSYSKQHRVPLAVRRLTVATADSCPQALVAGGQVVGVASSHVSRPLLTWYSKQHRVPLAVRLLTVATADSCPQAPVAGGQVVGVGPHDINKWRHQWNN